MQLDASISGWAPGRSAAPHRAVKPLHSITKSRTTWCPEGRMAGEDVSGSGKQRWKTYWGPVKQPRWMCRGPGPSTLVGLIGLLDRCDTKLWLNTPDKHFPDTLGGAAFWMFFHPLVFCCYLCVLAIHGWASKTEEPQVRCYQRVGVFHVIFGFMSAALKYFHRRLFSHISESHLLGKSYGLPLLWPLQGI